MKHRSDKFLRQDLIFPVCLTLIASFGIKGELMKREEFEKLYKESEDYNFYKIFWEIKQDYNIGATNIGDILIAFIQRACRKYLNEFMHEREVSAKLHSLSLSISAECAELFKEFFREDVKSHKFVLILHQMACLLNEEGVYLPTFLEEVFAPFLEIEAVQDFNYSLNKKLENDDWLRLKNSADKQAIKSLQAFKNRGYFIMKKS